MARLGQTTGAHAADKLTREFGAQLNGATVIATGTPGSVYVLMLNGADGPQFLGTDYNMAYDALRKLTARKHEPLAFSAPPSLQGEIDAAAARLGLNRSQFIVQAIRDKLERIK